MAGSGSDGKDGVLWFGVNVSVFRKQARVDKGLHGGMLISERCFRVGPNQVDVTTAMTSERTREGCSCEQVLLVMSGQCCEGRGGLLIHR